MPCRGSERTKNGISMPLQLSACMLLNTNNLVLLDKKAPHSSDLALHAAVIKYVS